LNGVSVIGKLYLLASFNEGGSGAFWSEAGGPSPWQMHPDCDEMLEIFEGSGEVEVLPEDGSTALKKL
jgi:mannose-6-phosphate isomerase-like protein (cupin superfamily)